MQSVLQDAIDAASTGSLYALVALGVALIFGVMSLLNFAHGEFIMIGAYLIVLVGGTSAALAIVAASLGVVVLALVTERAAFRPVRTASPTTMLVTSFAVSYLIQNILILFVGSRPKSVSFLDGLGGRVDILGLQVSKLSLVTIAVTGVLVFALTRFLNGTRLGVQMRAASEDFETARLLGVRANKVIAVAFGVSGLLAATVSVLLVAQTGSANPTMGLEPALIAFVATVVGGLGSLSGAALAGFGLGVLTVVLQIVLPSNLADYRDAFLFATVIVALLVRPQGLLGSAAFRERV
jgi:branched-chain amino acid transport system permease protein